MLTIGRGCDTKPALIRRAFYLSDRFFLVLPVKKKSAALSRSAVKHNLSRERTMDQEVDVQHWSRVRSGCVNEGDAHLVVEGPNRAEGFFSRQRERTRSLKHTGCVLVVIILKLPE